MTEQTFIQVRWGVSSRQVNITGWTATEYVRIEKDRERRILTDTLGHEYYDYKAPDGKHELIKKTPEADALKAKVKAALDEAKKKEAAPEKLLYDFVKEMGWKLCVDQFGNEAVVYNNKYYELNGREIKAILASKYFNEKESVFNDQTYKKLMSVLSHECGAETMNFPLRCYTEDNTLYYDTGREIVRFIDGEMTLYEPGTDECPIIFRRYNYQKHAELEPTNENTKDLMNEVLQIFNINDFRPECIPTLFMSEHPNPIMLLTGDPGAAKSTFSLFIKRLVDPDQLEKLKMPEIKNLSEFGMHRQQFYLLLYDNVRTFYQEQSDELCRMVTGGSSVARKLYTNGDLYITKGLPRIVINGLRPEPSQFNDLLDRTLLNDMQRIKESKPEKVVWEKLNKIIPRLRYACLRDMSKAAGVAYIQEFPQMPRMSEYCLLGEGLNVLWGGRLGDFVDWFKRRMDIAHAAGMDDPLTVVLLEYLDTHKGLLQEGIQYTTSEWRYQLVEWSKAKESYTDAGGREFKGDYLRKNLALIVEEKDFPRNSVWLGRRFRDISPLLNSLGFNISVIRTSKENFVRITSK